MYKRLTIKKYSALENELKMGHKVSDFHSTQLKEAEYIQMVENTASQALSRKSYWKILEVGAGTGILSVKLIEKLLSKSIKFQYLITEPDGELIEYCKKYIKNQNFQFNRYQQITLAQIKVQDIEKFMREKYDIIISTEVMHHIPYNDKIHVISEYLRILNKEGRVIIGDNFVADKYHYESKNQLIDDRALIAPKVAKLLESFWKTLWGENKNNWPESFKKALQQQREGFVECKTSLPHLINIIDRAGGIIETISTPYKNINENGGYATLVVKH